MHSPLHRAPTPDLDAPEASRSEARSPPAAGTPLSPKLRKEFRANSTRGTRAERLRRTFSTEAIVEEPPVMGTPLGHELREELWPEQARKMQALMQRNKRTNRENNAWRCFRNRAVGFVAGGSLSTFTRKGCAELRGVHSPPHRAPTPDLDAPEASRSEARSPPAVGTPLGPKLRKEFRANSARGTRAE